MKGIVEDLGQDDSEIEGRGKIRIIEVGNNEKKKPRPRPAEPCGKFL